MSDKDPAQRSDLDPDVERLLVAARPTLDEITMGRIERTLLGRSSTSRRSRRVFGGALGLSGALAAVVIVATLSGSGPLAAGGGDDAAAREDCETRTIGARTQPEGQLVLKNGKPVVVDRGERSTPTVQDCR